MKKGLVTALALVLFLALVPGVFAQQKVTVWCWDPNFNVYAMKQAAARQKRGHTQLRRQVGDQPTPYRRNGAGHTRCIRDCGVTVG